MDIVDAVAADDVTVCFARLHSYRDALATRIHPATVLKSVSESRMNPVCREERTSEIRKTIRRIDRTSEKDAINPFDDPSTTMVAVSGLLFQILGRTVILRPIAHLVDRHLD